MELFDTHCHLNDLERIPDPAPLIAEAHEAGVTRLAVVGIDAAWNRRAVEIAEAHQGVFAVVGWHPTSAKDFDDASLRLIRELMQSRKSIAIGEIGLDYHWPDSTREQQMACLHAQLDLAEELQAPVVFHCREAYDDLLDVLEDRRPRVRLLFHCFAGSADHARRATALDAWFGVDGPITYPKAIELRDIVRGLPLDKLVIETDAPWLAPAPFRGKPNRPAWVAHVNAGLAAVLGISAEQSGERTTANALAFFGL